VQVIEERQGWKIGCIEEVAFRMGWLDKAGVEREAQKYIKSGYGKYLMNLVK
jgi:glucose-1-phosphate thymidylyltransferase